MKIDDGRSQASGVSNFLFPVGNSLLFLYQSSFGNLYQIILALNLLQLRLL
jgi:hypothetical protein